MACYVNSPEWEMYPHGFGLFLFLFVNRRWKTLQEEPTSFPEETGLQLTKATVLICGGAGRGAENPAFNKKEMCRIWLHLMADMGKRLLLTVLGSWHAILFNITHHLIGRIKDRWPCLPHSHVQATRCLHCLSSAGEIFSARICESSHMCEQFCTSSTDVW